MSGIRLVPEAASPSDSLPGDQVGLAAVLDHLTRRAQPTQARWPTVAEAWRWDEADQTSDWWPQGMTSSFDATGTDTWQDRRLFLTSAYGKDASGRTIGSRITVLDRDRLAYRHITLLTAAGEALPIHAGGLAWYGERVHVAATRRGLMVLHLDDVRQLPDGEFVWPARTALKGVADSPTDPFRYSFVSVNRTGENPELVAGEYGVGPQSTRLIRYQLGEDGMPVTGTPLELHDSGPAHAQGASVVEDTWYVISSRGRYRLGHVHVGQPGAWRKFQRTVPVGPEDINWWPTDDSFWSLSEYPRKRLLFRIKREFLLHR